MKGKYPRGPEICGMKNPHPNILLVDDDVGLLAVCRSVLTGKGYDNVTTLNDSREVLPFLETSPCTIVFLDLMMPHMKGSELLPHIVESFPEAAVVMMTASDDVLTAVACMKAGAFDFLLKPVNPDLLLATVEKACKLSKLTHENDSLRDYLLNDRLRYPEAFSEVITASKKMRAVLQYIEVIAELNQPVLITGETGVGKELAARAVAQISNRPGKFVIVNVAGLDDAMFSDTLFGHRKGAFTGADTARDGLVCTADDGTLFLDEIGDLGMGAQVKLLRLIQEQEFYPGGSDTVRKANARIIVATNRDLQQMMTAGQFRKDLYYRLCAHRVHIPPLRERREDIPLLVCRFVAEASAYLKRMPPEVSLEVLDILKSYRFDGNVRELQGMIYDVVARCTTGVISVRDFASGREGGSGNPFSADRPPGPEGLCSVFGKFPTVREVEDYLIDSAMQVTKKNQRSAALLLGIARQTLSKRLQARAGMSARGE